MKLTLTEDELRLLYALAGRECAQCAVALPQIGSGLAGPHEEHEHAARTALVKLSDAVLELQKSNRTHAAAVSALLHFADPAHGSAAVCGETSSPNVLAFQLAFDPGDDRIDCPRCRAWLASQRRKPEEWCAIYGVAVYDQDGWREPGAPDWYDDAIGLREFDQRAARSTSNMAATGAYERIRRDLECLPQDADERGRA